MSSPGAVVPTLVILAMGGSAHAQAVDGAPADSALWHRATELRREITRSSPDTAAVFRLARLELALGRADSAHKLLLSVGAVESFGASPLPSLLGAVEHALGNYDRAAELFVWAARSQSGLTRGILLARAGDAAERAGDSSVAADHYRAAAAAAPAFAGWLGLREARITSDADRALGLLSQTPPESRALALGVRGNVLRRAGHTAEALETYLEGSFFLEAAMIARELGDQEEAKSHVYRALSRVDTAAVRAAIDVTLSDFKPERADELLEVARAWRRLGSVPKAREFARRAVAADSTGESLTFLAEILEASGDRVGAARTYERAESLGDGWSPVAAFRRGRLLLRLRRRREGIAALERFVARNADHTRAPLALYLVAETHQRARRIQGADSLYEFISARWPRDQYASRSRMRLALRALARRDTADARRWYQMEVLRGGTERYAAQYHLATLTDDPLDARGVWAALARADSLGYYGTIARTAAGMPPLNLDPAPPREHSPRVREVLSALDMLRAARFDEEADVLVEAIDAERDRPPAETLDFAEGLIARGYRAEGIRLGWRAAQAYTLNHPRVLRVVFPYPLREIIEAEAKRQDVDSYLLAGLIRQESAFRSHIVSRAGAHGLMQLMPATARQVARRLGLPWDARLLTVPDANLHLGVTHLAGLLRQFKGEVVPSLAAYNAGATPVRRWQRLPEASDPVRFVERVPYVETRGFLRTVLRNWALYRALYPPVANVVDGAP